MIATAVPESYGDFAPGSAVRQAIKWQVAGFALLIAHVLMVKQSVALYPVGMCLLWWLYANAPLAGIIVYFQFLIYQNWVIALFAVGMHHTPFVMLQGSNFIAGAVMAGVGLQRLLVPPWWQERRVRLIVVTVMIALGVAALYGVVGAAREGVTSASVYFREFTGAAMAAIIGLDVGRVWGFKTVGCAFLVSILPSAIMSVCEIAMPLDYYSWINAAHFTNLKFYKLGQQTFYGPADVVDNNTGAYLNISGEGTNWMGFRFMGSSMHPISYGYVLAVASLVAIAVRRSWWLCVTLPLLVLVGVKGALLLFVCTLSLWFVWTASRDRRVVVICGTVLLVAYIAFGIARGLEVADWHVLGFLGGVHGFLSNPIGRGLGIGGNISGTAMTQGVHWTGANGMMTTGADFALESAVGVLIYQMGVGSAAIFAVFFVLMQPSCFGSKVIDKFRRTRWQPQSRDVLFLAMATAVVNGVFQEEAYAPTGAALVALFCAMVLANGRRRAATVASYPKASVMLDLRGQTA